MTDEQGYNRFFASMIVGNTDAVVQLVDELERMGDAVRRFVELAPLGAKFNEECQAAYDAMAALVRIED